MSIDVNEVFRKHFGELLAAIQDPEVLACELYSANIITTKERDAAASTNQARAIRTSNLLATMVSQIAVDPRAFDVFLSMLATRSSMNNLLGRIREDVYGKLVGPTYQ